MENKILREVDFLKSPEALDAEILRRLSGDPVPSDYLFDKIIADIVRGLGVEYILRERVRKLIDKDRITLSDHRNLTAVK